MRASRNSSLVKNDQDEIALINLGADFTAEHEWGIERTYRKLGIEPDKIGKDPVGIHSRVICKVPENLMIKDFNIRKRPGDWSVGYKGTLLYLSASSWSFDPETVDPREMREMYDSPNGDDKEPLTTAWSDGDFAIFARKKEDRKFLYDLYEAMQKNDAVIWLGGSSNPFENSGLCLGIVSRIVGDGRDPFVEGDTDRNALEAADAATGIKERLRAASEASGKDGFRAPFRYFALSPKWATEIKSTKDGDVKTDYDVIYWLNPMDQENVNYGWFTVEQLDEWIEGKGPIPGGRNAKKKEAAF